MSLVHTKRRLPSGPVILKLKEHITTAVVVAELSIYESPQVSDAVRLGFLDL